MTTNKLFTSLLLVAFAALLSTSFSSCKKDDDDDDSHEGTGHLHIYFQNKMADMDLMYAHTHQLTDGRDFSFDQVQYYISNLRLKNEDGTEYPIEGIYEVVKGANITELELEGIPAGHYHGLMFNVGVDSTTNHMDPSTYSSDDALALQGPSMHWSWASGYIFMRLEGNVDTSAAGDQAADFGFEMHLGGDANLVDIDLTKHFEAGESDHPSITVNMDAQYLIDNNIDFSNEADRTTHTMDNMPLAMKLKGNISGAFSAQ